jgi:class 3 adenylate cyclase
VVAGVIGKQKFAYDLWGDTVNTAARMESHGVPGEIQVTPETQALLEPNYHLEERGWVDIKSKGFIKVFLLKGKR